MRRRSRPASPAHASSGDEMCDAPTLALLAVRELEFLKATCARFPEIKSSDSGAEFLDALELAHFAAVRLSLEQEASRDASPDADSALVGRAIKAMRSEKA